MGCRLAVGRSQLAVVGRQWLVGRGQLAVFGCPLGGSAALEADMVGRKRRMRRH